MPKNPARISIVATEAQKLLDYLQKRPYVEVFALIPILMTAEKLPAEDQPLISETDIPL